MEARPGNDRARRNDVADRLAFPEAVPEGTRGNVPPAGGRSQGLRLPDPAIENSCRRGRVLGQGTRPGQPEPGRVRTCTLLGFHSCGAGRRVRFCRGLRDPAVVCGFVATSGAERPESERSRRDVSGDGRSGSSGVPCFGKCGHGDRVHAGDRHPAAADELRRVSNTVCVFVVGPGDERAHPVLLQLSPPQVPLRPQLATPEARGKKEFEKCASQLGICNERAPTIQRGCSVWGGTSAPECPMLGCGDALRGVSMSKELVVSATPHETRVAILEDGQLCEIYIEREKEYALVGSIYKGRVTRVLPGMQSAFVDIGLDSDAFLYVSDFLENLEEYDHIVSTVEGKVQKMEQQGGQVVAPPADEQAAVPAVPSMPATPSRSEPPEVTEPSEAEVAHPVVSAESSAPSPEQSASAPPPASRPLERRDRAQGGYGRDRGSRGRWGRRGRGGERRPGRDLPPAKYASSRPYEPRSREPGAYSPHESQAAPPAGEVILLPGESLAKYKGRAPAPPAPAADSQVPPSGFSKIGRAHV